MSFPMQRFSYAIGLNCHGLSIERANRAHEARRYQGAISNYEKALKIGRSLYRDLDLQEHVLMLVSQSPGPQGGGILALEEGGGPILPGCIPHGPLMTLASQPLTAGRPKEARTISPLRYCACPKMMQRGNERSARSWRRFPANDQCRRVAPPLKRGFAVSLSPSR